MRTLFIFVVLLMSQNMSGQTYQEVEDSLFKALEEAEDPLRRTDLLNEISFNYRRTAPRKLMKYAIQANELAISYDYKEGMAESYKNMGIGHYKLGAPKDTTIKYYELAIATAKEIDDYYTQAACYNNLGLLYNVNNDLHLGLQNYLKGIEIYDRYLGEESLRAKVLMIGNVGLTFNGLEQYEKAEKYLARALKIAEEQNMQTVLSIYKDDYGIAKYYLGERELGKKYMLDAIDFQKSLGDYQSSALTLFRLVDLFLEEGNLASAEEAAVEAFDIATAHEFILLQSRALGALSAINIRMEDFEQGLRFAIQAVEKAVESKNLSSHALALENLASAYQATKDYQSAYETLRHYMAFRDSTEHHERAKVTAELEARYQNREKERTIQFLNRDKESQKRTIELLISTIALAVALILLFLYNLFKRNQDAKLIRAKNVELEKYIQYNLQLENFAYIASHDLKTPLRNIISFTQLLNKGIKEKLTGEEAEYLDFIINGSKELSFLIDDLLDYSRVQRNPLNTEKIDIRRFLTDLIKSLSILIEENQASIYLDLQTNYIFADKLKLRQLLQNLLTNAIKFHRPNVPPEITIQCTKAEEGWYFKIKDNGIGIDAKYFSTIFLIFKRLNNKSKFSGSGIGLAICKKIVEQHSGKIWLTSQLDRGSTFHFFLPQNDKHHFNGKNQLKPVPKAAATVPE